MSEEDFVKEVLDGMPPPPQYFAKNAMLNKSGYDPFEMVLKKGNIPLEIDEFEKKKISPIQFLPYKLVLKNRI